MSTNTRIRLVDSNFSFTPTDIIIWVHISRIQEYACSGF